MTKSYILLSVSTRVNTVEWSIGEQLLNSLIETEPRLAPERIGNAEPQRVEFVDVSSCREVWAPVVAQAGRPEGAAETSLSFLWKRSRVINSTGHVIHPTADWRGREKMAHITLEAAPDKRTHWLELFRRFVAILRPKYAMLHLFTANELVSADFKSAKDLFQSGPPGWALINAIPNLAWANYFGEELSQEVDPNAVTKNGALCAQINNGWIVTLTKNILDVAEDFESFSRQRAQLKKVFRQDLFMIKSEDPLDGTTAS